MSGRVIPWVGAVAPVALLALVGLGGCSGASDSSESGGGDAAMAGAGSGGLPVSRGGGAGAVAVAGATPSAGGAPSTGGALNLAIAGSPGSSGAGGAAGAAGTAACSAQTREGKRVPLDMYFLVDSSRSMTEDVARGNKWELVSQALSDFLNAPRNAELGTGIGYFPNLVSTDCTAPADDCICIDSLNLCFSTGDSSCSVADYEKPAVPLALSANSAEIVADLASHVVDGGTPTRPAVEGALEYLNGWASQHPERKSVLVLTTDGEPTECDANTPEDVAATAAAALAGPYAIQTFVIGVGDSLDNLDLVAKAGGTERAFLVDTAGDVATAFADALDKIRGAATSCDFAIPTEGTAGQKIDPHQVNVRYAMKAGGSSTLVPQVLQNDPKNCGTADGWYFDNPSAPSLIRLCGSTCQALNGGSIAIEFGCDTVVQQPR